MTPTCCHSDYFDLGVHAPGCPTTVSPRLGKKGETPEAGRTVSATAPTGPPQDPPALQAGGHIFEADMRLAQWLTLAVGVVVVVALLAVVAWGAVG